MKIKVNNEEVEATQMPFRVISEPWAEYHLDDGRIARVRVVVTKMFRLDGQKNENGEQMYSFQSQLVMAVDEGEQ